MLNDAILLFAIAGAGGIILANSLLRGLFAPLFVSLLHAATGLCGLFVVLVSVLQPEPSRATVVALWILVLAVLAGLGLTWQRLRRTTAPVRLVVVHATLAIAGFAVVLLAAHG